MSDFSDITTVQEFRAWAKDRLAELERSAVRNPAQEQIMNAVIHRLRGVPDTPTIMPLPSIPYNPVEGTL